jgi:signal transduction histidine kinase
MSDVLSDYLSLKYNITCNEIPKKKALIYAKENSIKRAITNIVNNAFQHGTEVRLEVMMTKKAYSINVVDNGPGILDENLDAVFENYFSLKNTTGIGLTIAREVVEYHQGEIKLKNSVNCLYVEIRFHIYPKNKLYNFHISTFLCAYKMYFYFISVTFHYFKY